MFDADTVKLFPLSNTLSGLMARPFVQNVGWWLNNDPTIPDNKGKKGGRGMTTPFVPETADMHKMVRSFVSFGAPRTDDGRGIKDGVGPNMADWTFFETIAHQSSVYRWQYYEIAERFNKYRRTQLPAIAHRAGYPSDTDWHTAL